MAEAILDINVNTGKLIKQIRSLSNQIDKLLGKVDISVSADTNKATKDVQTLDDKIKKISDKKVKVDTKVDSGEVDKLDSKIKSVDGTTVKVDGDASSADAEVDDLKKKIDQQDGRSVKINADTSAAQRSIGQIGGMIKGAFAVTAVVGLSKALLDFNQETLKAQQSVRSLFTSMSGQEVKDATASVKALTSTFDVDFENTLLANNALVKNFGITFEKANDLITKGFLGAAGASGELLDNIKEYPVLMREAGVNADEFITLINTQATAGVYSDKGIDLIKEANIRIREQTKTTSTALRDAFGTEFADNLLGGVRDGSIEVIDAIQQISQKLGDVDAVARQTILADVFGGPGEDAVGFLEALGEIDLELETMILNSDKFVQNFAQGFKNAGFESEQVKIGIDSINTATQNLQNQSQSLNNTLTQTFGTQFTDNLLSGIREGSIDVDDAIQKIAEQTQNLDENSRKLVLKEVFGDAAVGAEGFLDALVKVDTQADDFATQQQNLLDIRKQINVVLQDLATSLSPLIGQITRLLSESLFPAIAQISKSIFPLIQKLVDALTPLINQIVSILIPILNQLVDAFTPIVVIIVQLATEAIGKVIPVIRKLWEAFTPLFGALQQLVRFWSPLINILVDAFLPIVEAIIPVLSLLSNIFAKYYEVMLPILTPLLEQLGNTFQEILGSAIELVITILGTLFNLLTTILGVFFKGKTNVEIFGSAVEALGEVLKVVVTILKTTLSVLSDIISGILGAGTAILKAIGLIDDDGTKALKNFSKQTDITTSSTKGLNQEINNTTDSAKNLFANLKDNNKSFDLTGKKLGDLRKAYSSNRKEMKSVEKRLKSLKAAGKDNTNEYSKLNEQYRSLARETNAINIVIKEQTKNTTKNTGAIKGGSKALNKNVTSIKDVKQQMTSLIVAGKRQTAEFETLRQTYIRMTKESNQFKEAQKSLDIELKKIDDSLKTINLNTLDNVHDALIQLNLQGKRNTAEYENLISKYRSLQRESFASTQKLNEDASLFGSALRQVNSDLNIFASTVSSTNSKELKELRERIEELRDAGQANTAQYERLTEKYKELQEQTQGLNASFLPIEQTQIYTDFLVDNFDIVGESWGNLVNTFEDSGEVISDVFAMSVTDAENAAGAIEKATAGLAGIVLDAQLDLLNKQVPIWTAKIFGTTVSELGLPGVIVASALTGILTSLVQVAKSAIGAESGVIDIGMNYNKPRGRTDTKTISVAEHESIVSAKGTLTKGLFFDNKKLLEIGNKGMAIDKFIIDNIPGLSDRNYVDSKQASNYVPMNYNEILFYMRQNNRNQQELLAAIENARMVDYHTHNKFEIKEVHEHIHKRIHVL